MTELTAGDAGRVLDEFRPGRSVYIQGAVGEPLALRGVLASRPEALAGVSLTSGLIPGVNDFDYAALSDQAHLTAFMASPALHASQDAGRVTIRPLPYSQTAVFLGEGPTFDLAVFQVSPPDAEGLCSFGPSTDFMPLIWPRAGRRLAFINPNLPSARLGPAIPLTAIDVALAADGPIITGQDAPLTDEQRAIAAHIVAIIPDGAAIQTGIGGAPAAVVGLLGSRRNLTVASGMVTQGYRDLAEAGALKDGGSHITGMALGAAAFVAWAADTFAFADATVTHGAARLAALDRLFAVNSALEIDLYGQANVEWRGGRMVSGLGGAPDFARAARRSVGGRAILALPSTARAGQISRIVPRLQSPTVSIPRDDTDLVVTEYGVADLRGTGMDERAEALIAIAAPDHRSGLAEAWAAMRRG